MDYSNNANFGQRAFYDTPEELPQQLPQPPVQYAIPRKPVAPKKTSFRKKSISFRTPSFRKPALARAPTEFSFTESDRGGPLITSDWQEAARRHSSKKNKGYVRIERPPVPELELQPQPQPQPQSYQQPQLQSQPQPQPQQQQHRQQEKRPEEITYHAVTNPDVVSSAGSNSGKGPDSEKARNRQTGEWRPRWLCPAVLACFTFVFLLFTAGFVFMLWYSKKHAGLVETHKNMVYLWRVGPTAILTLAAVFWSRVELQAMRYIPWIAMRHAYPLGKDGYALDYTSMFSFVALIQSLQHRHYLVFLTVAVSFLLKVQIILAPGLYSLATVTSPNPVGIDVLDSFDLDYMVGDTKETRAYYTARSIKDFDMLYPFGVSRTAAYQTFSQTGGPARGSPKAPVTAVVDGFFADMQCLELKSHSVTGTSYSGDKSTVNVALLFDGCSATVPVVNYEVELPDDNSPFGFSTHGIVNETLSPARPCPNLPQDHPQVLFWLGQFERSASNASQLYLSDGAAVLCAPRAWVSKVKVVDDGISPIVTAISNASKTQLAANAWTMLYNAIPHDQGGDFIYQTPERSTWGPLRADIVFAGEAFDPYDASWFDSAVLHAAVTNLTDNIGPLLGHYLLRQDGSSLQTNGAALATTDKMVVTHWLSITMAVLFGICTFAALYLLVWSRRRTAIWYRDPANILGNMIFCRDHPEIVERIADSAPRDIKLAWSRCTFLPLALRPWARALFTFLVICLALGLVFTLRRSQSNSGIADVDEEGYWHLLWTSFPAVVALVVYAYVSTVDWINRDISTLYSLSTRACTSRELDASLLDMLGIRALYHALRRRLWPVAFTQVLAIACGLLTTLVAVLFAVETVPEQTTLSLPQQTWFGAPGGNATNADLDAMRNTRRTLGSLLERQGEANFTYPRNTYADLVFPALGGLDDLDDPHNKSIRLTMPAAQVQSTCAKLPEDKYTVSFRNYTEDRQKYQATMTQTFRCANSKRTKANLSRSFNMNYDTVVRGRAYIAGVLPSPDNYLSTVEPCNLRSEDDFQDREFFPQRTQTYVWGEYSLKTRGFKFLTVWSCNYTFAQVDTELNFINVDGKLTIDTENPPTPDPSTARTWVPAIDFPRDTRLGSLEVGTPYPETAINDTLLGNIDPEFTTLVAPSSQIPLSAFGDTAEEDTILSRLRDDFAFVQAQLVNKEGRLGLGQSSWSSAPPSAGYEGRPSVSALPDIEARVTDTGRRRLFQSPVVTWILIGVLAPVAIINILAMLLGSRGQLFDLDARGLAPKGGSGSVEGMVGLLRGSNAAEQIPAGTHLLPSAEELHGQLANLAFGLGWFERWDHPPVFTIGVLGDDRFDFRGTKKASGDL